MNRIIPFFSLLICCCNLALCQDVDSLVIFKNPRNSIIEGQVSKDHLIKSSSTSLKCEISGFRAITQILKVKKRVANPKLSQMRMVMQVYDEGLIVNELLFYKSGYYEDKFGCFKSNKTYRRINKYCKGKYYYRINLWYEFFNSEYIGN
jgi:hypothetical protein